MITKMILENFKSYAGVQEIGPFHKRFSSIVGPNGSGKSNVIDALLFVFGKRAKQLRLNKVSELIHKSSGFPNLEYARVAVYFQLIHDDEASNDDFEVVSGSEFIVTRTAFVNNSSKYTIDGKNSTYTEVGQVLRGHGIDLDNNRFLILQGEVEQIAMMKPKGQSPHEEGLLEYLEDIIGSNRYVEQIDETQKILDSLNDQRVDKVNRMKTAETQRDNLKDSKEEAELFLSKEREIRVHNNKLYQIHISNAQDNVKEVTNKLQDFTMKMDKEKAKLVEVESALAEKKQVYEKTVAEYESINDELTKTSNEFAAFERRDVKLNEDMKHNATQIVKVKAGIQESTTKEGKLRTDCSRAEAVVASTSEAIESAQGRKVEEEKKLDDIMEGLEASTAELRGRLEEKQASLVTVQRSVADFQTEKETVTMSLKLTQSRAAAASKGLREAEDKLFRLRAERANGLTKVESSEMAIRQTEVEISELTTETQV